MKLLLRLSQGIDALNEWTGRAVLWLVLAASLVGALNAIVRYAFHISSNAYLETQWYMFALIFLLASGYTLKHNGHVRVDVLYSRFSKQTQHWVDLLGTLLFLLPMVGLVLWLSWPLAAESLRIREMSPDVGGLPRWPIKLAVPVGFVLLGLQGVSEIIKRIAALRGDIQLLPEEAKEVA